MASTDSAQDLVRALYRMGLVQREIARHAMAELGSQGFVALAIVHTHEPMRVSAVARHLAVDLSVASRQIAALEGAGYVRRERDPDDGRAQLVSMTQRGEEVLSVSHRRMVAAFEDALSGWPEAQVDALAEGLDRLRVDFAGSVAAPTEEVAP